jgi:hypothetical protein
MNKLLVTAWILFVLDLVVLALMASEVLVGNVPEAERDYAVAVTWGITVWLCLVNAILIVGWWKESRAVLWVAVGTAALPLLRAWTTLVTALSG